MDRDKRIQSEIKKLNKEFSCATSDKKVILARLINRAAFLLVVAEDLETELKSHERFLETTVNATQQFVKANPLLKEYRDTVKSYQSMIKQLVEITKGEVAEKVSDDLLDFIGSND